MDEHAHGAVATSMVGVPFTGTLVGDEEGTINLK